VTVYSQHPNRGKNQILASYRNDSGVVSTTVTSVDDASLASRIADALNRISASATVPLSVRDERDDDLKRYPTQHIPTISDVLRRPELLTGTHSLWYELAMLNLHDALTDLDDILTSVPVPVRQAVLADLETEARNLQASIDEYSRGYDPDRRIERIWDSQQPFVPFDGGIPDLARDTREYLDHLEEGIDDARRRLAISDMRLLVSSHRRSTNTAAMLDVNQMGIMDDPGEFGRGYFLAIDAPIPGGRFPRENWDIHIGKWVPDPDEIDEDGEPTGASSDAVLGCAQNTPPTRDDLVMLLDASGGNHDQLAAWASTAIGRKLAGTNFIVTDRYTS